VREGLREIPELPFQPRIVFLGQQPKVVSDVEQPVEQG
jgi:hypothetical protein